MIGSEAFQCRLPAHSLTLCRLSKEPVQPQLLPVQWAQSLKGEDVVRVLEAMRINRGLHKTIKLDYGRQFISKAMGRWAYEHGLKLDLPWP